MAVEFVWLYNPTTGGYFRCPEAAVEAWKGLGFEPSDPPVEVNPAVVERIAWERQQAEERAAAEAAAAKARTTTESRAARRTEGVTDG